MVLLMDKSQRMAKYSMLIIIIKEMYIKALRYSFLSMNFFFFFLRAAPVAYGNSQASGQIGATAASLHQSLSNTRSELHL